MIAKARNINPMCERGLQHGAALLCRNRFAVNRQSDETGQGLTVLVFYNLSRHLATSVASCAFVPTARLELEVESGCPFIAQTPAGQ